MKKVSIFCLSLLLVLATCAGALAQTSDETLTPYEGEPGFSLLYDATVFAPKEMEDTLLTLVPVDEAASGISLTVSFDAASGYSLEGALDDAQHACEADGFTVTPYAGPAMLESLYAHTLHGVDGDNERIVCVIDAGIGIYTVVAAYPTAQAATYGVQLTDTMNTFALSEESGNG